MKQNRNPIQLLSLSLAAIVLLAASDSPAQSTWAIPSGGNWEDSANWQGVVPAIDLAAAIINSGTKVVTISAATPAVNRAARRLELSSPAGSTNTLRLDNLGSTPFLLANSFNLGAGGRLEVINSTLQLDGSEGGSLNQLAGEIILAGGSITTINSDPLAQKGQPGLRIGRSGTGRTTVFSGDLIAHDELTIGDLPGSSGTLILSNGFVRVGGGFSIANNPGTVGRVDVYGGTLIATNVTTRIGDDGDGTFSQHGGTVIMDGVSVGRDAQSVGRLNLRGGTLRPGSLSVGRFAGAQGTLEVSGGSLVLGTNSLYIGREGAGTALFSGGTAQAAAIIIAASAAAAGKLYINGGSLTTGQLIADKSSAQIQFDSGTLVVTQSTAAAGGAAWVVGNGIQSATLQLDGGTHHFANGLVISPNATLKGMGKVTGAITVLPGGVNQLGLTSSITLSAALINGRFQFTFASAAGNSYDVLAASDLAAPVWQLQATLAGTGGPLIFNSISPASPRFFRVQIH